MQKNPLAFAREQERNFFINLSDDVNVKSLKDTYDTYIIQSIIFFHLHGVRTPACKPWAPYRDRDLSE